MASLAHRAPLTSVRGYPAAHVLAVVVSIAVTLASLGPVEDAIERAGVQAADGKLDDAIGTIRSAREASDDPALIYVEAQLQRIAGNCEDAVPLYEAFLATHPPDEDRQEVDRNLDACREELGEPAPVVPPPVVEAPPTPPPELEDTPPPPAPAAQGPDRIGLALWISGGVLLAGGAATYGGAWGLRSRADRDNPSLDTYLQREQRARTLSGAGIAIAGTGAAVLLGAVIRHVVRRR